MIDQLNNDGGVEIPFEVPASLSPLAIKPYGDFIQLDYQKPTMAGQLHLPGNVKTPELIAVPVIAVGPDCKQATVGSKVVLMSNAILGGDKGAMLNGRKIHFTREQNIVGILEP